MKRLILDSSSSLDLVPDVRNIILGQWPSGHGDDEDPRTHLHSLNLTFIYLSQSI